MFLFSTHQCSSRKSQWSLSVFHDNLNQMISIILIYWSSCQVEDFRVLPTSVICGLPNNSSYPEAGTRGILKLSELSHSWEVSIMENQKFPFGRKERSEAWGDISHHELSNKTPSNFAWLHDKSFWKWDLLKIALRMERALMMPIKIGQNKWSCSESIASWGGGELPFGMMVQKKRVRIAKSQRVVADHFRRDDTNIQITIVWMIHEKVGYHHPWGEGHLRSPVHPIHHEVYMRWSGGRRSRGARCFVCYYYMKCTRHKNMIWHIMSSNHELQHHHQPWTSQKNNLSRKITVSINQSIIDYLLFVGVSEKNSRFIRSKRGGWGAQFWGSHCISPLWSHLHFKHGPDAGFILSPIL